ncbi:MAG: hypothetical protein IJ193_05910 [Bacilli bacterium]|nr:hypothetical protein [Bacilli bacterium]
MISLKSKTLRDYYGENPDEYSLKFIHYNVDIDRDGAEEYLKISEDLQTIYHFDKKAFLLYFSDVDNYHKMIDHLDIHNLYDEKIYLRISSEEDYNHLRQIDGFKRVKAIVSLEDLEKFSITDINLVVQIDKVKELPLTKLNQLLDTYPIKEVLLGQIPYLDHEDSYLYDIMSKMYHIDSSKKMELEKMNKITNDLYSIHDYVAIMRQFQNDLNQFHIQDSVDGFYKIFDFIANEVSYDDDGVKETSIDNQNLIGPVFHKKGVCESYSKYLQQMLSLIDIDSIIVQGGGMKEEGGHDWNQVFMNGKWYNADVTAASYSIHHNEEVKTCLVKDSALLYKTNTSISHICDEDFMDCSKKR